MLYSQEQLAEIIGMDRRQLRKIINENDIQPVTPNRAKDGRRMGKYRAADIFRALDSARYADICKVATGSVSRLLHPESRMIQAILGYLPDGVEPVSALSAIMNAGWDDLADLLGYEPEGSV